jgi:hypothetical protein
MIEQRLHRPGFGHAGGRDVRAPAKAFRDCGVERNSTAPQRSRQKSAGVIHPFEKTLISKPITSRI